MGIPSAHYHYFKESTPGRDCACHINSLRGCFCYVEDVGTLSKGRVAELLETGHCARAHLLAIPEALLSMAAQVVATICSAWMLCVPCYVWCASFGVSYGNFFRPSCCTSFIVPVSYIAMVLAMPFMLLLNILQMISPVFTTTLLRQHTWGAAAADEEADGAQGPPLEVVATS